MKFFRYLSIFLILMVIFYSCDQTKKLQWDADVQQLSEEIKVQDISEEYFDEVVNIDDFKRKYPWFQGSMSDEYFAERRKDSLEISIYKEAISKINEAKLNQDLSELFARIKHYFPKFEIPKVYLFSSGLQMVRNPIVFQPDEALMFIDISGFMGRNNPNYTGLEQYYKVSMNPQNIIPKVAQSIAETMIPRNMGSQKLLDLLVYYGKMMILQDAFLPKVPDYLKMNYTLEQYDWAIANEANIWNYFVESDLIFSDEPRLDERFFAPAPFSKFYTAIDNESSPQIGIFIGWQMAKKYFKEHPNTNLIDFLNMNGDEIFSQSKYRP